MDVRDGENPRDYFSPVTSAPAQVKRLIETTKVSSPKYYNVHKLESIEEMKLVFGIHDTITFCRICAWKYRYRAGAKGDKELDDAKADQYIQMIADMKEELRRDAASGLKWTGEKL